MRQTKADEEQMLWRHVKMPSRLHPPGFDISCSRPGARVDYAEYSVASEKIKCIAEGLPRVLWLLYNYCMTSTGACPHRGQHGTLQHFTFILGASPTKTITLTWVYCACKPSHCSAAPNLPLLGAFEVMTSLFKLQGKIVVYNIWKNMRGTQIPCHFYLWRLEGMPVVSSEFPPCPYWRVSSHLLETHNWYSSTDEYTNETTNKN